MLLKAVPLAMYICLGDFSRHEPHMGDFMPGQVGLFGLHDKHLHDDAFPLGIVVQKGHIR